MQAVPLVRVIVVDFDGGEVTLRCLRHLAATRWPADRMHVVLVDNGSTHSVVDEARTVLPGIEVKRLPENLGFAGGVNAGLQDLGDAAYVALVNNDAFVDPDWLQPLVHAVDADASIGAATAKILFASPFVATSLRPGTAAAASETLTVSGLRLDGADVLERSRWLAAGVERETNVDGITVAARLRLPAEVLVSVDDDTRVAALLEVQTSARAPVDLLVDGDGGAAASADTTTGWIPIRLDQTPAWRMNNAGTVRGADGYGRDRGFLEPDDGRFDDPCEIEAWSGCVALLRRAYLDDVGRFDERLFAYYEDLELSLRGRARGWTYRYEPRSRARHLHSATSNEGSNRFIFYNERNRLLTAVRHDPPFAVARMLTSFVLATGSYARRDVAVSVRARRLPSLRVVRLRLRAFFSFLHLLPGTLQRRSRDRRARK